MLIRHAKEFARLLHNRKYEKSQEGIFLPTARVYIRGEYGFRVNNGEWEYQSNLLPTEGLNWLLDNFVAAGGVAAYLSLYAGAISPVAGWTATSYPATATEITSGSEGYTESTRVAWGPAAAASAQKDNYSTPSAFTIATATTLTVNGVGLHTVSTKGGTTGKLLSATRFGSARSFSNTDEFDVKYRLALTSS